jgi:hypothetical protein
MICPRCQATMADNVSFCTNCGTQVGASGQGPAGSSPAAQPGYPPQGQPGYPPPAQAGYAPPGYPPQAQPGYPPQGQPSYAPPAQPGYPPQGQPGYSQPGYQPQQGQPEHRQPAPHHRATPPFSFDLKRLSRVDQVIGVASLILTITLFLPWFGVSVYGYSASESGFSAHGYLIIPLLTAIALIVYLVMHAGWDDPPLKLPVAHAPLLLVTTGVQFLIVLLAFLFKPTGTNWQFGAYLGLLAALVACAAIVVPAVRSMQGGHTGS